MSKIADFQIQHTAVRYGYGFGSGYGSYEGSGYGYGFGDGSGYGSGYGYGAGYVDGSGYGAGDNYGDELQYRNIKAKAVLNGYSFGILRYKQEGIMPILRHEGEEVHYIDDIPCIVRSIHDDWLAVDVISTEDFTTKRAFVAKVNGVVAHGDTLREAMQAAHDKFMASLNREERCKMFKEQFPELNIKYKAKDFFNWHGTVTGSCDFGRREFANRKNINIETDEVTVNEFFALTDKAYGSDTIELLKTYYEYN